MQMEVHKFGGTSVGDGVCIRRCAELVAGASSGTSIVVVSSAVDGVTDALVALATAAGLGDAAGLAPLEELQGVHVALAEQVGMGADALAPLLDALEERLYAAATLRDGSQRTHDAIVSLGEKLAVRLLAGALVSNGADAVAIDADEFLETDGRFGQATPLHGIADTRVHAALRPLLDAGQIPVVTGFCGRAPDGSTTTLGRGGSDYSATFIAGALGADEVVIWTDVEGVYSADPRIVPEARPVAQLNYREAGELSYYGAKVLHQRTIIPVAGRQIPVHIKSTLDPDAPGTVIDGRLTRGSHPVKGVSAITDQALVSVEGKGMAGVPGIASRVFGALAHDDISVTMISQSSSESSICLAVSRGDADRAEVSLKRAFRDDLTHGDVEEVVVQRGVALVAAVGLGMAHTPGVAARVCGALANDGINILAIAQGSSELNVSLAVTHRDVEDAVRALHHEFGLDRIDPGEAGTRRLDLLLLGFGSIGRGFAGLLRRRHDAILDRLGLDARIVAVCDRSGYLLDPLGLANERLQAVSEAKQGGASIASLPGCVAHDDPVSMLRAATEYRLARPILIDASDADLDTELFDAAFANGVDVVTANKRPLAGPPERFRALMSGAREHGRRVRAEATVGAGLPVVDTLEMLIATGDVPRRIEGCLSGTLAFVIAELEAGKKLSEAVADAVQRGYTEPDPAIDLGGEDVARKALILGRLAGLLRDDATPEREPFIADLPEGDPDAVIAALRGHDDAIAQRLADAGSRGAVLRYVARVEDGRADVGLREVPASSNLGNLTGTDNMLVFTSDRYDERPLVITGPGAGIDVTAMAVLGDVLRIAAERADTRGGSRP
ncbi:MAG: aspartate kinase [Planctomycetes bacterium]|nr:aspartate kinase [Planctomycetota bacterium]